MLARLRYHQPTKDYLTRRLAEGKPKNEIIRCLKRYIAREVFAALQPLRHEFLTPPSTPLYERRPGWRELAGRCWQFPLRRSGY